MKRLIFICLLLFIQAKTISQNKELILNTLKNQNIERIDSIAKILNHKGGIVRVYTMFTVNDNGEIKNVQASGPHRLFEQEAIRIINMIPKLDPKEFKDGVKISLPISFMIETRNERIAREKNEKRNMEKELKKLSKKNSLPNI